MTREVPFEKWHGAGNDFLIFNKDDVDGILLTPEVVAALCRRRLGVGSDGMMIIEQLGENKIGMEYFNADGFPGSMCGNGGRCAAEFAFTQQMAQSRVSIMAVDGAHSAKRLGPGKIALRMNDAHLPVEKLNGYFVQTGSPHFVLQVQDLNDLDVHAIGTHWRKHPDFAPGGTNVNFYEIIDGQIHMRTFERGVEEETLSCGTGTVAVALVQAQLNSMEAGSLQIIAPGGQLTVDFQKVQSQYRSIVLSGPAQKVYAGKLSFQ